MLKYFRKITNWILPRICCICENISNTSLDLCSECKQELPWLVDYCYNCGLRLEPSKESIICSRCQTRKPVFDRVCALFSYDPPISNLISGLKFGNNLAYGNLLGSLLAEATIHWYKNKTLPEAIIPIPLHKKRLKKRGFNQAIELIRPYRKRKEVPVLINVCQRRRSTKAQSGLNEEKRKVNLKNAFQVVQAIPYQHVAIVDDVLTTGSTANALSFELKKAGVELVDVWCIART